MDAPVAVVAADAVDSISSSSVITFSIAALVVPQFNEMIDIIRYVGQNSIDLKITKKTKESDILTTIGRRRFVNSENKYGENVIRCTINDDGHCLFDALAFLFLYYAHDHTIVSYELVSLGWLPCISQFISHGTCKGNMLDILVFNSDKIIEDASLCEGDTVNATDWFNEYSDHLGEIVDYPCSVIAYIVFRLLFKSEFVQLCIHQIDQRTNQYLDATGFVNSQGSILCLPLSLVSNNVEKKKIHLWHQYKFQKGHFEPALLQSDQEKVCVSATKWIDIVKQMMYAGGIGNTNKRKRK